MDATTATHRTKPAEFRALQFTDAPGNDIALSELLGVNVSTEYRHGEAVLRVPIPDSEGRALAVVPGDWIVVDSEGRALVMSNASFRSAYEEVPAEEVPAEEVPAEEVPAEEVPAEPQKSKKGVA